MTRAKEKMGYEVVGQHSEPLGNIIRDEYTKLRDYKWTALLVYILLRLVAWQSKWKHTFTRLFTLVRGALWRCVDLFSLLACCGTAHGKTRIRAVPERCYLPGFSTT